MLEAGDFHGIVVQRSPGKAGDKGGAEKVPGSGLVLINPGIKPGGLVHL